MIVQKSLKVDLNIPFKRAHENEMLLQRHHHQIVDICMN